jgi:heptaprenyl diphosphate synthase
MNNKVVRLGIFLAFAMVLSYVEALIPIDFMIPGAKIGLANLCIVLVLYLYGPIDALVINIIRVFLTAFMFTNLYSFLLSLCGALISFIGMYIMKRTKKFEILTVSAFGGICHNIGQLLMASVLYSSFYIMYYSVALIIIGLITGVLIGFLSTEIIKRTKIYLETLE